MRKVLPLRRKDTYSLFYWSIADLKCVGSDVHQSDSLSLWHTHTHILFHCDLLQDIGYPYATCCCSVAQLCLTLCDPMDCITPGFPALHHLLELAQTHVHWVGNAIQPSHLPSSPSPPAFNLSQHQGLFQWVSSLHQVAKLWELQLQHQSFQHIFWTDFL